jgi:hypothetical protein
MMDVTACRFGSEERAGGGSNSPVNARAFGTVPGRSAENLAGRQGRHRTAVGDDGLIRGAASACPAFG